MEAKKVKEPCAKCGTMIEMDFATAQFAMQVARVQGKTTESRTFYAQCPQCQEIHSIESTNKEDWGNRKAPSAKKLLYGLGFGCVSLFLVTAVIFYFAGRGLVTVLDWLFQ